MATPTALSLTRQVDALLAAYSARSARPNLSALDVFKAAIGLPDPWQVETMGASGDLLINTSRQSGKSTTMGALGCAEILKPQRLVLCLAPSERQSIELLYKIGSAYRAIGQPIGKPTAEGATHLYLGNGSRALALPAKETNIRTYSANLLLMDEAAMIPDNLFQAVRPMLAVTQGSMCAGSTPKGKRGWFYHLVEAVKSGKRIGKYLEVPATEISRIPDTFLEQERLDLPPPVFQQEYCCSFEVDAFSLFDPELLQAAIKADIEVWNL